MENNSFEQKVRRIDWAKYLTPEYYAPEKMSCDPAELVKAQVRLNRFDNAENESGNDIAGKVRYSVGNDHRGAYCPAAAEAMDLIIEIEKHSAKEEARKCAKYILNDRFYFRLELSNKNKELFDSNDNLIRETLDRYSDENI